MTRAKPDETQWFDVGFLPVNLAFVPSEQAWKKTVKLLGEPDWEYPTYSGCCSTLDKPGATFTVLISVNPAEGINDVQVAGCLAHEAVHFMQYALRSVTTPGKEIQRNDEIEAYLVQFAFQCCFNAWQQFRKKGTEA